MKTIKAANDNLSSIYLYIGDIIAMLSMMIVGIALILGGTAYGIAHCQSNNCAGYEQKN